MPVTILEKSRGVGGRMSARRWEKGVFDHGAQFITVRSPEFQQFVEEWKSLGIVREWSRSFPSAGADAPVESLPRLIGIPGMTAVAKHLARDLDVRLNTRIVGVDLRGNGWVVHSDEEEEFSAAALLLTAPLPQSLMILDTGTVRLPHELHIELHAINYHPCLAVLARLDGPSAIPEPGGLHLGPEPVRWVADNRMKGISPADTTVTIHAGPIFSEKHYSSSSELVASILTDAVQQHLGSMVLETEVHRWRYSEPTHIYAQPALLAIVTPPLAFAGDAFAGARIEGAALSGIAAADILLRLG
jgi:hypothetical protein